MVSKKDVLEMKNINKKTTGLFGYAHLNEFDDSSIVPAEFLKQGKIDIKRAVSEKRRVTFNFYRAGYLYYTTEFDEIFSVPISDTGDASFNANEKAIMLMRYMRKWNEGLEDE